MGAGIGKKNTSMKLTRLRLIGFKSFVEPTDFLIEPGLTGVVGPNGCGKSTLVEALRWVMGESSYKNMRASGMDDVIFSGSATRPSRNTAEVTLFLDNSDRSAPPAKKMTSACVASAIAVTSSQRPSTRMPDWVALARSGPGVRAPITW